MPIDKISDIRRLPRLGKIRLGIKKEGQRGPYPQAVDYFVCPEEVKAVHGDTPKELPVMFPLDDLDLVAPQWYKCYSYSQGLVCKGNGKTCRRKVDCDTGDFADKDTERWEFHEGVCEPDICPKLAAKQCRKMMSLLFILHEVPGLGVYQLDTSSFYSIVNLNSQLAPDGFLRHFTQGRIAFIPLKLSIGPQEVTPPGVGRKTVHVLSVRADVKLADIVRISRQKLAQILLPTLKEDEPPEDLYPDEVLSKAETREPDACHCPKPVLADEVVQAPDGPCFHRVCGGYLCTPPIDCFPGCPHTPLEVAGEEVSQPGAERTTQSAKVEEAPPPAPGPATQAPGPATQAAETRPSRRRQKEVATPAQSASDTAGTFKINESWLKQTLKDIIWTETTAKTWLASQFKIDTKGELVDIISRLTPGQAALFAHELEARVQKKQPELFAPADMVATEASSPDAVHAAVFLNWGELAAKSLDLEVSTQEVFKRGKVSSWREFPDYATAWAIINQIVLERKQVQK